VLFKGLQKDEFAENEILIRVGNQNLIASAFIRPLRYMKIIR
jgi:hypothetical protein